MDGPVRIRLSSALTVELAGRSLSGRGLGSRKARTLLALLASERGRLVPADRIADVLWAEDPPADPHANVSTLVSRTRRLLGDGVLAGSGRAYGLLESGGWSVDLDEAAGLVDEAGTRLAAGEHALAVAGSRRALDLLGNQPALVDEPDADWVRGVRREADGLRKHARHLLTSALSATQPGAAEEVAQQAVLADPFDERAVRDLMRAAVAAGRPAAALTAYDALTRRLRHELGTDPAAATSELHVAVLRESALPTDPVPATPGRSSSTVLVGRERELRDLERAWSAAGDGRGGLLLVEGEAGIGKTRLLEAVAALAERTGGRVLRSRCHPTERSLFLQPYVDALRPVLLDQREPVLAELLSGHEAVWTTLLPELAEVLPARPWESGTATIRRRRAYDAVVAVVRRLTVRRPLLLEVDDLHDGGAASVDLLGYLAQRLAGARVLLVAGVRTEHQETVARLADRAERIRLGALPRSAVDALASAAGLAVHGPVVMARTGGHPLSVVECLRALAAGDTGVPASLADAVSSRVASLAREARDAVEAASVLGHRVEPRRLADLAGTTELAAVRQCEELVAARLMVRRGAHYEFANDLVQECVLASLVPALAVAYHRRAADLTIDQPETMAEHAFAAGDVERAAQGWLLAGEAAMGRSAVEDAADLFGRGLETTADPVLRARLLLARAVAGEARTTYAPALADIEEALGLARASGNRRLEMDALRARGGDVPIGLHLSTADVAGHLESALLIATDLGARTAEADIGARLTILDISRLRLASALTRAERMLARAGSRNEDVRVLALDGLKAALAYLGDADRLGDVVAELEPMLRRRDSTWLLQWTVFEAAFVPASVGAWDEARDRVDEALRINRRSGYPAYSGFFEAHQGWFDRLAGDLDGALVHGRRAVELSRTADHPWWYAAACGLLAATLVEVGRPAEAEATARRGLAATAPGTAEAWRLRCAAPLAAVSDDEEDWRRASGLLRGVECPPGAAWVAGADCYLLVGRAAQRRGSLHEVAAPLGALRQATATRWSSVRDRLDDLPLR
jgi:DNA-binding SARP family transcriptional activator/tetratricopeptide (TPR) repeat protein